MRCDGCSLAGLLPTELGLLANLGECKFAPFGFGSPSLSALVLTRPAETEILQLSTNTLTGMIPTEIGLAPKLTLINVARNQLSGMLPSEIGQLMVLGTFGVSQSV